MIDAPEVLALDSIGIDPRECELCGLTIDRHRRDDTDEGPIFYCLPADELNMDHLELRVELIRQVEVAAIVRDMELNDPRDAWRHTGETPPATVAQQPYHLVARDGVASAAELQRMIDRFGETRRRLQAERQGWRKPAQSTIDAFRFVVRQGDPARLEKWLLDHSDVSAELFKEVGSC